MLGISVKSGIGIGDGLQFSSLPENYFNTTGSKLIDVSEPWFFDHNPYVVRGQKPSKVRELWNFSPSQYQWPIPRSRRVLSYLSNAEIWASALNVQVSLSRPRLYRYEDTPFESRKMILLHTDGRSHGTMPERVVQHVIDKYSGTGQLYQIGKPVDPRVPWLETPTLWDLAFLVSQSRMVIGVDSGPSWVAACYPDVQVKVVRMKPTPDILKNWMPLEIRNVHSHWDDRCRQTYNPTDEDLGFTWSYRRI